MNVSASTFKGRLNDPETAYVETSDVHSRALLDKHGGRAAFPDLEKYEAVIVVRVRAKNLVGAYGPTELTCPLVNGSFNTTETLLYQTDQVLRSSQQLLDRIKRSRQP
jgi:hypothetical protein